MNQYKLKTLDPEKKSKSFSKHASKILSKLDICQISWCMVMIFADYKHENLLQL